MRCEFARRPHQIRVHQIRGTNKNEMVWIRWNGESFCVEREKKIAFSHAVHMRPIAFTVSCFNSFWISIHGSSIWHQFHSIRFYFLYKFDSLFKKFVNRRRKNTNDLWYFIIARKITYLEDFAIWTTVSILFLQCFFFFFFSHLQIP